MGATGRTGTQSLERGFALLNEVAASDISGIRLVDLVARTKMARSTAHRLLGCMVEEGLLIQEADGRYHLGRNVYNLGLLATHRYDVNGFGFGPLRALAESLGDTVFLTRRVGLDMVCVERIEGENAVKILSMTIGTRRPLGIGAGGLALLASLDKTEADAIILENQKRIETYYGEVITNRLGHRVQIARRNGYALSRGLLTSGVVGVGVAVEIPRSVPTLSLSVVTREAGLSTRHRADIVKQIRTAAREVSRAILDGTASNLVGSLSAGPRGTQPVHSRPPGVASS